jgi:hypothetical protein
MRSLLQVTAALQKQITRDFMPIWGINATVDAFADLTSVPSDYQHVTLFNDPGELARELEAQVGEQPAARLIDDFERDAMMGIHLNALTRQPFALVKATDAWTVVLSHEVLEMLADPSGNRLVAATHPTHRGMRVKYLVEICDPCQAIWYPVNGVPVADFYTPRYFDPVAVTGSRYSYTGSIERPLEILDGGYLTFLDPQDSALYQIHAGSDQPVELASLQDLAHSTAPLRTLVDGNARTPQVTATAVRPASTAAAVEAPYAGVAAAAEGAALCTAGAMYALAAEMG